MRTSEQKLKLLYIMDILNEYTNKDNYLHLDDIVEKLRIRGIHAEGKSVSSDIQTLISWGGLGSIEKSYYGYHIVDRNFTIPEVKMLIDIVQSSNFITENKSRSLIEKLRGFVSRYDGEQINQRIHITGRSKTTNESILDTVETIYYAMAENKKVTFDYGKWEIENYRPVLVVGENQSHEVSPWELVWNKDNYYLRAIYETADEELRSFRIDRIYNIKMINASRAGDFNGKRIDAAGDSKATFSMYDGKREKVKMRFSNKLMGVVVDKFGTDITMIPKGDYFEVAPDVDVSVQFYGWLAGLDDPVSILNPQWVANEYIAHLEKSLAEQNSL